MGSGKPVPREQEYRAHSVRGSQEGMLILIITATIIRIQINKRSTPMLWILIHLLTN